MSTPDVISSFQKQIDHSLYPCAFSNLIPSPNFKPHPHPHHIFTSRKCDQSPGKGTEDVAKPVPFYPDPSQVGGGIYCYLQYLTDLFVTPHVCYYIYKHSGAEFRMEKNAIMWRYTNSLYLSYIIHTAGTIITPFDKKAHCIVCMNVW